MEEKKSGFRATDFCLPSPEICKEIEFEANEETNEMSNKESEGGNNQRCL
jgi:hypothetical protein